MDERPIHDEVRSIIQAPDLLWKGHFALASGRHSDTYWEKFRLLQKPQLLQKLCQPIAQEFEAEAIDTVVGPTLGGVIVAYEVARQMSVNAAYAERDAEGGGRHFRQPIALRPGERVLIVDDVFMTGWTIERLILAVHETGAKLVAVAVILDRRISAASPNHQFFAVHRMPIADHTPATCPQCATGIPLVSAAGTT